MAIHSHSVLEHIGKVYGCDLECVCTAGRPDADVAKTILSLKRDFDCFIVNESRDTLATNALVISAIAQRVHDWVEVFGVDAEAIHDAIDLASVDAGRQQAVGDGNPMTSWNLMESVIDAADYMSTGGHGTSDLKLLVHFGSQESERHFVNVLKATLARKTAH
jgi:hypothetical protein